MHLLELIKHHATQAQNGVPDWMLGYYKRSAISFADGTTDIATHVCWLQSRNFTIDLRLPINNQQVSAKPLEQYTENELRTLGNYEGWEAPCEWDGTALSWLNDTSLQYHNRWTEPGILHRIGNCMIELCPSNAYVEDWRLQPSGPGPLVGLRLIDDTCLDSNSVLHRGGGLIVCGDYAALVLGRPDSQADAGHSAQPANQFREALVAAQGNTSALKPLLQFETSVAHGSLSDGYKIQLTTCPHRNGQSLLPLDGFEFDEIGQQVLHRFTDEHGRARLRRFSIDTIEADCHYSQATPTTHDAKSWLSQEAETLTRYTQPLFSHSL
ncbi:hypothetical protein [Gilvimarinus agarilyticus]|uniref:hypothetical protein n=1 Tax=Gilvimarinus agarilyticus TaxID=679259 RepID=UPI0005A22808|nr:hypothetical protein [Gilvimarinus agarilyticus]